MSLTIAQEWEARTAQHGAALLDLLARLRIGALFSRVPVWNSEMCSWISGTPPVLCAAPNVKRTHGRAVRSLDRGGCGQRHKIKTGCRKQQSWCGVLCAVSI